MLPSDYLKRGWTQGANAKNKHGGEVLSKSQSAVCWCFAGAVIVATDNRFDDFIAAAKKIIGVRWITEWNDAPGRTQAEVVALAERVERELGLTERKGKGN